MSDPTTAPPDRTRVPVGVAAQMHGGVNVTTVIRWADSGRLGHVTVTPSGHRRILLSNVIEHARKYKERCLRESERLARIAERIEVGS